MSTSSVLITGCSSGIGPAVAEQMRSLGWRVIPTARKAEDVARLREQGFAEAMSLDVNDSDSIRAAVASLGEGVDALVNNAGYGQPGALEDLSRDAMRQQFETNVFGLQELTNALLPGMIRRGHGRVVHVSSVVGRVALPFMGIYSASKFAVEAMADAQRVELMDTGVFVSLVEPGPIITRFSENAVKQKETAFQATGSRFDGLYEKELNARAGDRGPKAFALPPEAVAKAVAHALTARCPRKRYKVTFPAYLGALLSRLAPDALIDGILKAELRKRLR